MSKHYYFLSFAMLALLSIGCVEKQEPSENLEAFHKKIGEQKLDDKTRPYEDFYLQRSYPNDHFDIKYYEKVMRQAKEDAAVKGIGFDAEWTVQGPGNIGARINTVALNPENNDIIYAGFSNGGVWRTTNGGASWQPIFDEQLWPSIADIAIDPSDPQTVYVATGDPNISGYPMIGDGLYKSSDGGDTWENIGLSENRVISEVAVHPTNPDILYASSMGVPFIKDNNRGLYRTLDGGQNWEQVLFVSDSTGIIDILIDPFNPDVIYASGWDRVRSNTQSLIIGEGAKIFKTSNGGDDWEMLGGGLPTQPLSRTGLAHSQITPDLVYAMFVDTDFGLEGIYKSTDAGVNWEPVGIVNTDDALSSFGWYFGKLRTHPQNDDDLFLLGVGLWRGSVEDGIWDYAIDWWEDVHADKHDLVYGNNGEIFLATDGGLYKSTDDADTWSDIENIPTTQFYRVAYNPHEPDWYYGGAQDNGTTGGFEGMFNQWPRIYGGDGFTPVFHPTEPDVFYCETQNGNIVVTWDGGGDFYSADDGIDNGDRRHWDMPYIMSSHNSDVLYAATYRMYKSIDGANPFFFPISEQLTDSVTLSTRYHTITTISESPIQQGLLYTGAVDASVWRTDNDGDDWIDISDGLPVRYVTEVKASPHNVDWVYVTHSGFKDNDFLPRIHRSKDRGENWEDISNDLPDLPINDVYILPGHADSVLFVATDAGVYASLNSGENWQRLGTNMPYVPVYDIDRNVAKNTIIAGTFARSIMTYPIDSLLHVVVDTSTSVSDVFSKQFDLKIHPNPASDVINISAQNMETGDVSFTVFDKTGKTWLIEKTTNNGSANFQLNVASLPAGEYFIKGLTERGELTGRFVKI